MKEFFTNFKRLNWKIVALFAIVIFYIGISVIYARDEKSPIHYGGDYLAFWSAGKVADTMGFSQIYNLDMIKNIQTQTLYSNGILENKDYPPINPNPAPIFSLFVIPFKYLSRLEIGLSYRLWILINFVMLVSYLIFFG